MTHRCQRVQNAQQHKQPQARKPLRIYPAEVPSLWLLMLLASAPVANVWVMRRDCDGKFGTAQSKVAAFEAAGVPVAGKPVTLVDCDGTIRCEEVARSEGSGV